MHGRYEVFSGERIVVLVTIVKIHYYILLVIIMPSCTTDQCEDLEITLIRLFIHNKFCLFPRHAQRICHRLPSVCKTLHSCAICYCRSTNFCRDTVMMLLALLNPEGTAQRKRRRLKRRVYRCKVYS